MAPKARSPRFQLVLSNPGKRKVNNRGPRLDRGVPRRPRWLSPAGKVKFRQLARPLVRMGVMTALDGDALAAYCQAYAELREATMALERDGRTLTDERGNVRPHPAFAQQQQALKAMRAGAALFGLDPVSRQRIAAEPTDGEDELEGFLKGS
jgi:P27 family predicted phage terminase small subunit